MNTIICPNCEKEIELSKAITHKLREDIAKEQEEKFKLEIEKAKKVAEFFAEKKANEKLARELEILKKEKIEDEGKRKEQEEKLIHDARKKAEEEMAIELKTKDLQLSQIKRANEDIKRANEDLKRKLEQGSQQMQGEVLEVSLEEKLKNLFSSDELLPVPKGFEGADILQKVRFKGKVVGTIIWETKRTKAWSNDWTIKLKEDAAKISASEAILVSNILPNGVSNFDRRDGVWITTFEHAINICRYVRFLITSIAIAKSSVGQTEEEWGKIRDYMLSDGFKHKMRSHFDGIKALRDILDAEKRATILRWKRLDSQIDKLDSNTINFYAELKTIVPNLPEIKEVDAPVLTDGQETISDIY